MQRFLFTMLFLCLTIQIIGQCDCEDCPITVPDNGSTSSIMNISGASNPTLGSGGQQVCQICLEMISDAIPELDVSIIAPDGSSVDLILSGGIGIGQNINFEICFLSCDQPASPDGGFPVEFDGGAGYASDGFYNGTYYPADGNCLEDLTGSVDGTWELAMTDNFNLDQTTINGWTMAFADDNGLGCTNPGSCLSPPSCLAEGGELNTSSIMLCQADPGLSFTAPPSFPSNNEPPASDYDYTYLIVDVNSGEVVEINTTIDLTTFPPGEYQVCGLSYLTDDESLLPSPGGSLTLADIQNDIDGDVYCADISDVCVDVEILPLLPSPVIAGPTMVCPGQTVVYEILDYDPSITYLSGLSAGSFSSFSTNQEFITIAWLTGPGELCVSIFNPCAPPPGCINVDVTDPDDLEIMGNLFPCPGSIETYDFLPTPNANQSYVVTVTDGTVISQTNTTADIEWASLETTAEICIELVDVTGGCVGDPICEDVQITSDFDLPTDLNSPDALCLGEIGMSNIANDPDIITYTWTATNLTITAGQGTNQVSYEGDAEGTATICLEIIDNCNLTQGPICEDLDIYSFPDPMIVDVMPTCDLEFNIDATISSGTSTTWDLISGPGSISFTPNNGVPTMATVTESGMYTIALVEDNNGCISSDEVVIEILASPTISDPIFDCNLNNQYTVSFDILTGTAPFTINGIPIGGSSFTSDLIDSGDPYSFEIIDDFGCMDIFIGDHFCPCISDAGTMPSDLLTGCFVEGIGVTAVWDQNGELDADDTGLYYLHDGDASNIGNILAINDTGEFLFDGNFMFTNVTYYVSYVIGNDIGGEVDFADPCLSI